MAKKRSRKSRTSAGVVGSPAKARTSTGMNRLLNQLDAWSKGKRVVLTVPNSNTRETNRRLYNETARNHWGLPPVERNKANKNEG